MHTPETRARAYEKVKKRRLDWFYANGPCVCGSWDRLELDHVNPKEKVDHKIWSWSQDRRDAELVKCQALCYRCHKKKTAEYLFARVKHGERTMYDKYKCRCGACRAAHAKRLAEYHDLHPRSTKETEFIGPPSLRGKALVL